MKWIIYFLLVFNIGFAAWHFRGLDMREDGSTYELDLNNEHQLILLSELQLQSDLKNTQGNNGGAKLCFSLGPFTKKSESGEVQDLLNSQDIESRVLRLRDTSRRGFWVILPASRSRKDAQKQIARLKKLKVKDYFLVATGENTNAISLGVFSQKKFARRRVDEIIRLGFVPRMEGVALPRKVYWLNWYKDSENPLEDLFLASLKEQYPKLTKTERSCK